jgi:hypothetical protein
VEAVTHDVVGRVTDDLFSSGGLSATVLGAVNGLEISHDRLALS